MKNYIKKIKSLAAILLVLYIILLIPHTVLQYVIITVMFVTIGIFVRPIILGRYERK